MPLYDCMLLLKPHLDRLALLDLVARVGKHVMSRNGVLTDIQSYGNVQLGYGIKKLDGRYYQGTLMQMTMMATPNLNKELHYLNKEDRLLRWLLVKHRDVKYREESSFEDYTKDTWDTYRQGGTFPKDDTDDDSGDDDDEYDVDEGERK